LDFGLKVLIIDQLKKNEPQLRFLTLVMLAGLGILLAGLWWVQIVSARDYQANLEIQSVRSIRFPAVRGRILDRTGVVLAENRPVYQVNLYLDELRRQFDKAYAAAAVRAKNQLAQQMHEAERKLGRKLSSKERKQYLLSPALRNSIRQQTRYAVASNVVRLVSQRLQQPITLDFTNFQRHYERRLALPFPVLTNISPTQIAQFEEQLTSSLGLDLEIQSLRVYPAQTAAAHLLGYLQRDDSSMEGEGAFFWYRLPDYRGKIGIEFGFDSHLHGRAGEKSVLVNNLGYRQAENIWSPTEPGRNVILTIDLHVQQVAEQALQSAPVEGPPRGAAVVMDVRTGDILALASAPTFNPNAFIPSLSLAEYQRLSDPRLKPEFNRATQENYAPGSIFKTIVGLACLETGLDHRTMIYNPGHIYVGRRLIHDLAPPGYYDFRRAIMFSSNTYFITNGMKAGVDAIIKLAQRLHLGERMGLPTRQETSGILPGLKRVHSGWSRSDTASLCIGQGEIAVTPLQMAVMTAALGNGGKVLWPRLVDRIEPQDPTVGEAPTLFPSSRVRDHLGVSPDHLQILREAMRDEVEDAGTGARAVVPGLRICGKTGTAQVANERNQVVDWITWFISFAPYEDPRYAVVVMVESGSSGGSTCAPIAAKIYEAILESERMNANKPGSLARNN
jgi:penicillin-binding protein 2